MSFLIDIGLWWFILVHNFNSSCALWEIWVWKCQSSFTTSLETLDLWRTLHFHLFICSLGNRYLKVSSNSLVHELSGDLTCEDLCSFISLLAVWGILKYEGLHHSVLCKFSELWIYWDLVSLISLGVANESGLWTAPTFISLITRRYHTCSGSSSFKKSINSLRASRL